ncbi:MULTISPECIES: DUF4767 domain-containing protein [unclassified Enterococcus]|uniref:DUF4767 domain-containing protein n=1 Tax=unclassified Enterococcus TaxID=2608891 RepID=UPI0015540AD1|nr:MULTISPECIES: DUF4767 domain-containing protein [unclassified Enterococcus]MBS7577101.1 DUF4767 domain-containing protein [Enterococcus sp. MMGLQ5-2]MBS7584452.1 DUF4767 domain-containing protein [Enterococcus sp. MMGLQ5-1]NPD12307.1 DUF4767 domain-containing protein [Enterococcus sp. MMGLQ5-1]NPD36935.1 DUF4767 domain-containing protein [Enterococcus sp. MMGLQ5-2]
MKKWYILVLLLSIVLMTSCRNRQEKSDSSVSNETSYTTNSTKVSSASNSSSEEEVAEDTLWNTEKSEKLNSFMINWGQAMNRSYKQYSPNNNVDLYGLSLPASVLNNSGWQAVIGDTPIVLNWSEYGDEKSDYSLVAVYSDAETQPEFAKHVYFFTIYLGQPKVLITTQNQGNENNYLYFTETENFELRNGFNEIVTNNIAPSSSTQTENINLGVIRYKDLNPNDFIQNKAKWLGCSIEDDGTTVNLLPAMSATIQNLQLYTSGQGNEEYYDSFLDVAKEVSLHTGGKPVSIWSTGGDGQIVITAKDGVITYQI